MKGYFKKTFVKKKGKKSVLKKKQICAKILPPTSWKIGVWEKKHPNYGEKKTPIGDKTSLIKK